MPSQRDVEYQIRLLRQYRQNLRVLLDQVAQLGGPVGAPLSLINNIDTTLKHIELLKKRLRAAGVAFDHDSVEQIARELHTELSVDDEWEDKPEEYAEPEQPLFSSVLNRNLAIAFSVVFLFAAGLFACNPTKPITTASQNHCPAHRL